jgi:threonine/homoserine/homoserine lactone efflux protein
MLWAFVPIAIVVTITPGAATAMVVRSAMRGGLQAGLRTIAGNSVGVVVWALLSIAGISALVAASEVAFVALKVTGALVLVWLGLQSFRRAGAPEAVIEPRRARAFRDGLVTSLANPKLAVFFVALFPQFVGDRGDVLPTTLAMAAMIVCFDVVWYSTLALLASRAKAGFMASRAGRWLERATGTVLIALGVRVALD